MKSLFPNRTSNSEHRKLYNLLLLLFPASAWLSVFFVLPVLIVLLYSFLERGTYGGITWVFTLSNYQRLFSWVFLGVIGRSLFLAFLTTAACLLVGYPLAFFIATRPPRWRNALLLLIIIPFWTNFLVRTYAWIILLRSEGVVNIALQNLQIITEPLNLLFTPFAVAIGLIYGYLPFMVLPLYSSIERFNFSLVEAAQDLGANDIRTFWRVFLPLTTRGIVAGSILVFVPAVGAFITPDILGGSKTIMVGNLIQNQFMKSRDWPFGSALSMLLTVIILVPVLIYFRVSDETE
ncbi:MULTISPECIES: ABC transporter permease [unclassified Microcoleus]|uniref:ABC transporter permease n=1 Tax=unclassified Microcoleus TaxID=2642155 RepID=UPI001DF8FC75|nr:MULTISPECIES: ABC transporter permease [unclassified Microcoleus]MCC3468582.1 ABC transporter permease [Microcoleus sp. PH2017_06_SFM_O_A]TAF87237.1 MAG: ABC transporter permease [Oscillatoriales cyanobacterium]MCC3412815.1 ABC transporter permease [Microcoleus sp. PH2017_02_FOX_O_A]MCC3436008.1 ABC transporter permease [Microcoleus sp. PH2017_05_CCC_O_A]MCC3449809.1 ABC transporter permease [Microcoleus sp. PH2017_09_SFU_O_A]